VITFLAVVIGWVFFRSETLDGAFAMLLAMSGDHGLSLPNAIGVRLGVIGHLLQEVGVRFTLGGGAQFIWGWLWITGALLVAFVAPNSLDIMSRYRPVLRREKLQEDWSASLWPARLYRTIQRLKWRPTIAWAMTMSLVLSVGFLALSQVSEFLYFQF
ncbi:MAG: MBOAT family protein, partial [Rhodospirillales bacterium]|nr:MBOAT family protein [Rhodospirillales bacterium]